jgi:hypothetical protein
VDAGQAAPPAVDAGSPTHLCIRFEACVDGSDFITVASSQLDIQHRNWDPIGENASCQGTTSTVNPSVSLYDPTNGRFAIDGVAYPLSALPLMVSIETLATFDVVQARGPVTQSAPDQILVNDDSFGGATVYVIDLCD